MKKICLFFILLTTFFVSCNRSKTQLQYEQINKLIGKRIVFPDSMRFVDIKNDIKSSKFIYDARTPIKITTNVDGNCHVCINHLKDWTSFIDDNKESLNGVSFLFFVHAYDYGVFELLVKDLFFAYPVVYDAKEEYIRKNNLLDTDYQTFLLNENNDVCLVGSPVKNKKMAELYIQEIKKLKNNL